MFAIDADENEIIFQAIAFKRIFRGTQNTGRILTWERKKRALVKA